MDWKSIVRVSLNLFALLCALLFVLPLGLTLWGIDTAGTWIWRFIQRHTSNASDEAFTRLSGESAEQHEEVTPMAFLPMQQEGTGSQSGQPVPVHNQSGLSGEEIVRLHQIYERSLPELAEIRALAEKTYRNEAQG